MMQVWFSCSLSVPSEHGVKITALKEQARTCNSALLMSEGMKEADIYRKLSVKDGQNCLPKSSVYDWVFKGNRSLLSRQVWTQINERTNKTWSVFKQWFIQWFIQWFLETVRGIVGITARLGKTVLRPWCKPLVLQPFSCQTRSA